MQMSMSEKMQVELHELFSKQAETLRAESLGDLTVEELLGYEQRYERIHELCAKLFAGRNLAA